MFEKVNLHEMLIFVNILTLIIYNIIFIQWRLFYISPEITINFLTDTHDRIRNSDAAKL